MEDGRNTVPVLVRDGYVALLGVFVNALDQAQEGKGARRHASGEPFMQQPIMYVARQCGDGFLTGQAVKKIFESARLDPEAAEQELLGAMNYLAAAVLRLRERRLE